jgi:hypothetical protein
MSLEEDLLDFLRYGDDEMTPPEQSGIRLDLHQRQHEYLAREIAAWLERREATGYHDVEDLYE